MSDALVLLGVLATFYLHDCSLWLPRDATVFLTHGLRGWRPIQSRPLFSRTVKGLVVSFRLPPLTPVYLCEVRPQNADVAADLNAGAVRNALEDFTTSGTVLRILCNVLFAYLFLVLPAVMMRWSVAALWPALLTALVVLVVPIVVEFRDIHAWLWPTDASSRRSELAHMALYPPAALRAHDLIAHRVCRSYHPLAVAAVLCTPTIFAQCAAQELRRLHHPLTTETDPPAVRTAAIAAVRRVLAGEGLRPETLLAPPPHLDPSSVSYCPRCETSYTIPAGTCADCPGVSLVAWPDAPAAIATPSVLQELP